MEENGGAGGSWWWLVRYTFNIDHREQISNGQEEPFFKKNKIKLSLPVLDHQR